MSYNHLEGGLDMNDEQDAFFEHVIRVMADAKWTDWLLRADGSYTRLMQFAAPITEAVRTHIVLAVCLQAGPEGVRVLPGQHFDSLSGDRRLLRLRVVPSEIHPPVPVFHSAVTYTNGLFGCESQLSAS